MPPTVAKPLLIGLMLFALAASMAAAREVQVSIDAAETHQTMEGFGTMWTYWAWLPEYDDPAFFDAIVDDLGVSLVRVEIPASLEPSNDDADPNHFNWDGFNLSDMDRLLRFCQEFDKRGVKRFLGDTFSPPGFLKTNRAVEWGGAIRADMWDEYAEFMTAFIVLARKNYGINISDITIQNELLFIEWYGSCVYHPQAAREAVRALMRRFKRDRISTQIHMPEDMMFYDRMMAYIAPTMADPETREFPGGFCTHRRGGFDEVRRWRDDTAQYGRQNWMTETSGHPQDWSGAMKMASDIYDYVVGGNFSVWVYLRLTQPARSGQGLMVDGRPAPKYYAAKHYYRYVRPGAVRVGANCPDGDLLVSAFRHDVDGTLTVVLINRSDEEAAVRLAAKGNGLPAAYALYCSSETEGCEDKGKVGARPAFIMPARSIVTLFGHSDGLKTRDSLDPTPVAWSGPGPEDGQRRGRSMRMGAPAIVFAAGSPGDVDRIRREAAAGVDVNTADAAGWTALHAAILHGNRNDAVGVLLALGADVNRPAADGWTPLHMAAASFHNDRYAIFRRIMDAGPNVNAKTADGWTPLHAAAASAHVAWGQNEPDTVNRVRDLVAAGARLEAKDVNGRTPLHWAAMQGFQLQMTVSDGIVAALIEAGADVRARDDAGRTPLHYAAEQGYDRIVAALLAAGASPDARDSEGATPTSLAEGRALASTVRLLTAGPNAAGAAAQGEPAVRPAGRLGRELMAATLQGDADRVRALLARGADTGYTDSDGFRPIDRARDRNFDEIVRLLEAADKKQ
jgi:glucuronoarabinoxylan endo-1,4-beta-xylanase